VPGRRLPDTLPRHLLAALTLSEQCEFTRFGIDDVPHLCALELSLNSSPWSEKNFLTSLNSGHLCLGICNVSRQQAQSWLAYAVCSRVLDEAELLLIGVSRAHQGKGLGRALLMALLDLLKNNGTRNVFLEVRASNTAAIHLYESTGFNCVGERPAYYPPAGKHKTAEDALIFALEFVD